MQSNGRVVYSTSTLGKRDTSTKVVDAKANDKLEWKITAKTDHAECHELFLNGKSIRTKWRPLKYSNSNRSLI